MVIGKGVAEADAVDVSVLISMSALQMAYDSAFSSWSLNTRCLLQCSHPARTKGWVLQAADDAGLGQRIVVFYEDEVQHQADELAGGEVFTSVSLDNSAKLRISSSNTNPISALLSVR